MEIRSRRMLSLLDLPDEILHYIVGFVSLSDLCHLGAASHRLYGITHDQTFWLIQLLSEKKIWNVTHVEDFYDSVPGKRFPISGIVRDQSLFSNRELYIIYSKEYCTLRQGKMACGAGKAKLPYGLPKLLYFYVPKGATEVFSPRLALFGQGIESPRTKRLVHNMINARNSTFDTEKFVAGPPGGFGSSVRVNFKKMAFFDVICLYTSSEHVRDRERTFEEKFDPDKNRLLQKYSDTVSLNQSIMKLLPTLDGLIYAIDITKRHNFDESEFKKSVSLELNLMLDGFKAFKLNIPVVILMCVETSNVETYDIFDICKIFELENVTFSWFVISVEICNMIGCEKALHWLLYHIEKKKDQLKYHLNKNE